MVCDDLNLDELRMYLSAEKARKARLKKSNQLIGGLVIGFVLLTLVLQLRFWIFNETALAGLFVVMFVGWFGYYRVALAKPPYLRMRRAIEKLLLVDQVYQTLYPRASLVIEWLVLFLAVSIGVQTLSAYQQLGIPITAEMILSDLSAYPEWATSLLLGWGIAAVIALWWIFKFAAAWRKLGKNDRRKAFPGIFRLGLGMTLSSLAVLLLMFQSSWPAWLLMLIACLILLKTLIEWLIQRYLVRSYVLPHLVSGHYDEAQKEVWRFLRWYPSGLHLRYFEALILTFKGDFIQAEKYWFRWLADVQHRTPTAASTASLMMAHCLDRQKRYDEAHAYIVAAVEMNPESSLGYLQMADHYMDEQRCLERALELTEFAQTLPPALDNNHRIVHALALAYNGEMERAASNLEAVDMSAIQVSYEKASILYSLARIARLQGKLDDARKYCEEAIQTDPKGDAGNQAREYLQSLEVAS